MTPAEPVDAEGACPRLRPVRADDATFLLELYASTRAEELDLTGWDAVTRAAFVEMQFSAQYTHYTTHYPEARHDIIELRGDRIGRLWVRRDESGIVLMDIAILPAFRDRGLGSRVLRAIIDEAAAAGCAITLHVEVNNPRAHIWYRRFGFVDVESSGVHTLMRRGPGIAPEAAADDGSEEG